jgi:hypothetical protein
MATTEASRCDARYETTLGQFLVRPVAQRRVRSLLATAEPNLSGGRRFVFHWSEICTLMGSVTERLFG